MTPAPTTTIADFVAELDRDMADRVGAEGVSEEVANHLVELRDELVASGASPRDAESIAIERFGPHTTVTAAYPSRWVPRRFEAALIVALALCAVGVAGLTSMGYRLVIDAGTAGHSDQAVAIGDLARVLAGLGGCAALECLWLYRGDRGIRPHRATPTAMVAGVIGVLLAVLLSVPHLHPATTWAQRSTAACVGVAAFLLLHRCLFRTERSAPPRGPRPRHEEHA